MELSQLFNLRMFPSYGWLTTSPFVDICIWGQITPGTSTQEASRPESNSAEREIQVLVQNKLTISQQCIPTKNKANSFY